MIQTITDLTTNQSEPIVNTSQTDLSSVTGNRVLRPRPAKSSTTRKPIRTREYTVEEIIGDRTNDQGEIEYHTEWRDYINPITRYNN